MPSTNKLPISFRSIKGNMDSDENKDTKTLPIKAELKNADKRNNKKNVSDSSYDLDNIIELAKTFKRGSSKKCGIYIEQDIKEILDILRNTEELAGVPTHAFVSAILDVFIQNNLKEIKELTKKIKTNRYL